jgi:hypothetical protein
MNHVLVGALLTLVPLAVRAQDVAPVTSSRYGGEIGPIVAIAAIDSDSRALVEKLLELRGYEPARGLDMALRLYAHDAALESPPEEGWVAARTLDELGAGHSIAIRWGRGGPRALELTPDEILRLNAALRDRGVTEAEPRPVVDEETLAALRAFQRLTGHPVQRGDAIERRWLFILGVATEESTPRSELEH